MQLNLVPLAYRQSCTGTVIDDRWVLVAGHCINYMSKAVAKHHVYIGNWEEKISGVPIKYEVGNMIPTPYEVKAVFSSVDHDNPKKIYPNGLYADFALLELEKPIDKSIFTIIPLLNKPTPESSHLISIGYGYDETRQDRGKLNYQPIVYYTGNKYPKNTDKDWFEKDVGEEYILGSIPVYEKEVYTTEDIKNKTGPHSGYAAWKITSNGDSGSPLLYQDHTKKQFYVVGTLTGGITCDGVFYSLLPNSYSMYASTYYWGNLLNQIIDDPKVAVASGNVKCLGSHSYCVNN